MNRQTIEEPRRSARLAAQNVENKNEESNTSCAQSKNRVGRFELVNEEHESSPRDDEELNKSISSSFPIDVATISLDRCKFAQVCIRCVQNILCILILYSPLSLNITQGKATGLDNNICQKYVVLDKNLANHVTDLQKKTTEPKTSIPLGKSVLMTPFNRNVMSTADLDSVLPNHDMLYPQWKAFSSALENYTGSYNTLFIGFASVQLDTSILNMLTPGIMSQQVTSLYFMGNNLGGDELLLLSDIIEQSPTMEALAICRNKLGDLKKGVSIRLASAIRTHPNLQRLVLASCSIGNNKTILSCIRNKSLISIDMSSNDMSSDAAKIISKFIAKAKNRHVTQLCLEDNNFDDKDAILFASALRLNNTLTTLDLGKNVITDDGKKILLKSLFDDSSLNAVSDSNHKCRIIVHKKKNGRFRDYLTDETGQGVESFNVSKVSHKFGRRNKIHHCMFNPSSDGGFVLSHYEDMPLELLPEVLGLIKYRSTTDTVSLAKTQTLMFELLRATPCIFLYKNTQVQVVISRKRKFVRC